MGISEALLFRGYGLTVQGGPYSRFYWRFKDEFADIYADKEVFGWWMTLLSIAEAAHPSAPEMPRRIKTRIIQALIDAELLTLLPNERYRVKGVTAEMERRSKQGKAGADARWNKDEQSERNADGNANALRTQSLDETRRDEQRLDKAIPAVAKQKPRPNSLTNEPRLTEPQLRSWDNFGPEWSRFKEEWLKRGMLYAPFGSPDDDDTSQRGLLFQVLDARPNDIVQWVIEAPLPTAREVITYILERWHDIREDAGVEDDEWQTAKVDDRAAAVGRLTHISDVIAARR